MIIVYANVNLENIVQIAITREGITGKELSCETFIQSSIAKYNTQIKMLLANQRSLSENKNDFSNVINYYGFLLSELPVQDRRGMGTDTYSTRESLRKTDAREIGRALNGLLIKPVEEQIKEKKNLIIIPDGILTFYLSALL